MSVLIRKNMSNKLRLNVKHHKAISKFIIQLESSIAFFKVFVNLSQERKIHTK